MWWMLRGTAVGVTAPRCQANTTTAGSPAPASSDIYDYIDGAEPMLARMAVKRESGYLSLGYQIVGIDTLFSTSTVP
jgi:hypothetical protein